MDRALEGMQALSAQLATLKSPDIIEIDRTIELPQLPLVNVDDVLTLNNRLTDAKFLDQMVRAILSCMSIYVFIFIYFF